MARHSEHQEEFLSQGFPAEELPAAISTPDAGSPVFGEMGAVPEWDENAVVLPSGDQPSAEAQAATEALLARHAAIYGATENKIRETAHYMESTREAGQPPDVWDNNRALMASSSAELLRKALTLDAEDRSEQTAQWAPFDAALRSVYEDFLGSADGMAGPDRDDFIAGTGLLGLTDSEIPRDWAGFARVAGAIRMLTLWGMHKLGHHANLTQLSTALDLIERYSCIAGFDPDRAGLFDAESAVEVSLAALEADRSISAKAGRNIGEEQPYRVELAEQLWSKAGQIASIRAWQQRGAV